MLKEASVLDCLLELPYKDTDELRMAKLIDAPQVKKGEIIFVLELYEKYFTMWPGEKEEEKLDMLKVLTLSGIIGYIINWESSIKSC